MCADEPRIRNPGREGGREGPREKCASFPFFGFRCRLFRASRFFWKRAARKKWRNFGYLSTPRRRCLREMAWISKAQIALVCLLDRCFAQPSASFVMEKGFGLKLSFPNGYCCPTCYWPGEQPRFWNIDLHIDIITFLWSLYFTQMLVAINKEERLIKISL